MIITEYFMTREDGVVLNRTFSDIGMMIERNGVLYEDAIDPSDNERVYTETDEPIRGDLANLEMEQKALAYDIITGVSL